MQADERFGQPLVIAGQASKARHPGEAAFHDPAAGQQHKAALGGRQFDDLQANPVGLGLRGWLVACVALSTKATSTESPVAAWI